MRMSLMTGRPPRSVSHRLTSYISEGGREDDGKDDKKDGDAPPGASVREILFVEMAGTRLWISILMQIVPHGQKGGV